MDIPKTCKAMILEEFGKPDVLRDVSIPELKEGDVLVKVLLAGVCGTDVHQQAGDLSFKPPVPAIQGHETVGRIVKSMNITSDVVGNDLKEGDRVMWCHQWCGKCYACKILQQPYMCEHSKGYGFAPPQALRGGFAEYELITAGTDLVRIPDSITDEEALGVGCAFRSVISNFETLCEHGGIKTGENVVVQGAGPIGLYAVVMAAQSPASKVIVIDMSETRLDFAKKWGATDVINMNDIPDPKDRAAKVRDITCGRGADVIIEASGNPVAFLEGMDLLAKRGRYVVIGQSSDGTVPFAPGKILEKYAVIMGNKGADIRHFYKALLFIEAHKDKYPFAEIISHGYRLEDANEALQVMREGEAIKSAIDNRGRY